MSLHSNKNVQLTSFKNMMQSENITSLFNELVEMYKDTVVVTEQEATKRKLITDTKDVKLKQLSYQRECFLKLLDHTFDERKAAFEAYFKVVDSALENNDNTQLSMGLESIVNLAKEAPFNVLADPKKLMDFMDSGEEFNF